MSARVALVKSAGRADVFAEAVRETGMVPVLVSPFRCEPLDGAAHALSTAVSAPFAWIALTSPHAAPAMSAHAAAVRGASVAAVGPGTAAALHAAGVTPTIVGTAGGAHLGRRMVEAGLRPGDVVIHVCGEISRGELAVAVNESGGRLVTVPVYRMAPDPVGERAAQGEFAALIIGSPRLAERAADLFPSPAPAVAIGRTTAAAMRDMGWRPAAVAASATAQDVRGALESVLPRRTP